MENILLSIEGLITLGSLAGLLLGMAVPKQKIGCLILLAVPIAMFFYVGWWQSEHPENLRSTSAVDFLFGPLWPSLGALAGFYAGRWLRSLSPDR